MQGYGTPQWQVVLDFWFADGLAHHWPADAVAQRWFNGGAAFDDDIEREFGALVDAALMQELVEWEERPEGRLALVLVLDQFTRNIHRGSAQAFAGDHRALTLVMEGLARGMDLQLPPLGRAFFYMPLMHAEDADIQAISVARFAALEPEVPATVAEHYAVFSHFARDHAEVIAKFGRFPHRNEAFGRETSTAEQAYLETANRYGQ